MISHFRPACLALALIVTTGPVSAQTWIYEPDVGARVYQPRVHQERYVPRVYNSYAYEPVVSGPPVEVVPTQRTVINRTIIPDMHQKAAEHHEQAAKAHRTAAQQHGSSDHVSAKQQSAQAVDKSKAAHEHSTQANNKSEQQK